MLFVVLASIAGSALVPSPAFGDRVVLQNPAGWPAQAGTSITVGQALEAAGVATVSAGDDLVVAGIIRLDANESPAELSAASLSIGGEDAPSGGFLNLAGGTLMLSGDIRLGDGSARSAAIIQINSGAKLQWGGALKLSGSAERRDKKSVGLRVVGGMNTIEGRSMEVAQAQIEFTVFRDTAWAEMAKRDAEGGVVRLSGDFVADGATIVLTQMERQENADAPSGEYLLIASRGVVGEIPQLVLEGFPEHQVSRISLEQDERGLSLVVAN